ncbi:hypothetical protein [Streptomyces sp. NPDC050560]|uniref:hypothetical protein n=1 Tax=Streptomyces sp. NPDC050560 TaxID=3365630 RepID=UPI0037AC3865
MPIPEPATAGTPPSMKQLLASCAAARAISTPPPHPAFQPTHELPARDPHAARDTHAPRDAHTARDARTEPAPDDEPGAGTDTARAA